MSKTPPRLPLRFFRWYCHPKLRDSIEGDLIELYEDRKAKIGKRKADLKLMIDVLLLFRPGIIRPTEGFTHLNTYGMLKNYLKISWRNLVKQKMYSSIKIGGFAVGVAACLLIALFIKEELSYDQHYSTLPGTGCNYSRRRCKKRSCFSGTNGSCLKRRFCGGHRIGSLQ
jgi:putative ABC transport system permease protein